MGAHWRPKDYCPQPLRTVARVLADARPAFTGKLFRWYCAGGDWWGVDPPNGILPGEICARIPVRDRFVTAAAAMDALRAACEGLELDAWGGLA